MNPHKVRPYVLTLMLIALLALSACDKMKAVYCTTLLPTLAQACQAPISAEIRLNNSITK